MHIRTIAAAVIVTNTPTISYTVFLFGYKDNASLLRYTALFILLVTKPLIFQSVHAVH